MEVGGPCCQPSAVPGCTAESSCRELRHEIVEKTAPRLEFPDMIVGNNLS